MGPEWRERGYIFMDSGLENDKQVKNIANPIYTTGGKILLLPCSRINRMLI
jgi:hypothetical protein